MQVLYETSEVKQCNNCFVNLLFTYLFTYLLSVLYSVHLWLLLLTVRCGCATNLKLAMVGIEVILVHILA